MSPLSTCITPPPHVGAVPQLKIGATVYVVDPENPSDAYQITVRDVFSDLGGPGFHCDNFISHLASNPWSWANTEDEGLAARLAGAVGDKLGSSNVIPWDWMPETITGPAFAYKVWGGALFMAYYDPRADGVVGNDWSSIYLTGDNPEADPYECGRHRLFGGWAMGSFVDPLTVAGKTYTTQAGAILVVPSQQGLLPDAIGPPSATNEYSALQESLPLALVRTGANSTAQGGVLQVEETGAFSYQPPPGFEGLDSWSYEIRDALGRLVTVPVTFNVGESASYSSNIARRAGLGQCWSNTAKHGQPWSKCNGGLALGGIWAHSIQLSMGLPNG